MYCQISNARDRSNIAATMEVDGVVEQQQQQQPTQALLVQDTPAVPGNNGEQLPTSEQLEHDVGMDEGDEYYYEGDDYRHFPPRARGAFR